MDQHGAALTLYARLWCRAPEDAVQEAFIDLAAQDKVPDNTVAWLFVTVRRRAMNRARSESRRDRHQRQAARLRPNWFQPDRTLQIEPDEWQSLLARLPVDWQEVVVARIWGGRSFAEIADLLGTSTSSVHRYYQQALASLQQMIEQMENTGTKS